MFLLFRCSHSCRVFVGGIRDAGPRQRSLWVEMYKHDIKSRSWHDIVSKAEGIRNSDIHLVHSVFITEVGMILIRVVSSLVIVSSSRH